LWVERGQGDAAGARRAVRAPTENRWKAPGGVAEFIHEARVWWLMVFQRQAAALPQSTRRAVRRLLPARGGRLRTGLVQAQIGTWDKARDPPYPVEPAGQVHDSASARGQGTGPQGVARGDRIFVQLRIA
jgi:hypothetical protein